LAVVLVITAVSALADTVTKDTKKLELLPLADADPLSGYYSLEGNAADNEPYTGVVFIVRLKGVYQVSYTVGESTVVGVGVLKDNQFLVGWAVTGGSKIIRGMTAYTVKGSELDGYWASLPGNGKVNREKLLLLKRYTPPKKVDDER
jgi:hypothetical protein